MDLWLHFQDETSQTKRLIARFTEQLDRFEWVGNVEQQTSCYEEYVTSEMRKSATRDMLCGRGARKHVYPGPNRHDEEPWAPPYHIDEVDLVQLTGSKSESDLFTVIVSNTIGKLGPYNKLVQSIIRALPDGILCVEGFPGAGKTTLTAAIDACLCLLSEDFKITVIAAKNAALDALAGNLDNQLQEAVTKINKELGLDSSGRPKRMPLVLRMPGDVHKEIIDLIHIVKSEYECGPDSKRPNTLCELLLQLLGSGPHRLPTFAKFGLTQLAATIRSEDKEGFQKLRRFVAGEMTWENANLTVGKKQTNETPQPDLTAHNALKEIIDSILPLVNVLVCTSVAAASDTCKAFVMKADLCQIEEAGAMSSPQTFAGWRGIGQPLIVSGDSAQFGPFMLDYQKHIFQLFLTTSTLDMIKTAGYPVFLLNTQHRAIDGQFDAVYENFYSGFKSIMSPTSQCPDNHPDAQRVEAAFVADFAELQPSPAGRILPMFIHVPGSVCKHAGKSQHCPQQTKAATYLVKKLMSCDVKPADIMVIGAYRAEVTELRKIMHKDMLVTTVDAVQGQERPYVVFVFATNKAIGPRFTTDPSRLCVAMSRQKYFLALVGDIDTVDYKNIDLSSKDNNVRIANIHSYFVTKERFGTYDEMQHTVQDDAEIPEPFYATHAVGDEEEEKLKAQIERLKAQMETATAALEEYRASKSSNQAVHPTTGSGAGQPNKSSVLSSRSSTTSETSC